MSAQFTVGDSVDFGLVPGFNRPFGTGTIARVLPMEGETLVVIKGSSTIPVMVPDDARKYLSATDALVYGLWFTRLRLGHSEVRPVDEGHTAAVLVGDKPAEEILFGDYVYE